MEKTMGGKFQNINFELERLPTMSMVASQIMELMNTPDVSAGTMAKIVAKDAAVAARVLKIANSSFYRMSRQVSSLSTAIVILGDRTFKNLALAASMRGLNQSFGKTEKMLWEDSVICALGSRYLALKLVLADPEEAFMAGLFRHIGLVVLNNQETSAGDFILQSIQEGNREMAAQERQLFGATHAEIGAAVLEHWRLSEVLSLVALHHADVAFDVAATPEAINLAAIVNIAGHLPGYFGIFGVHRQLNLGGLPGPKILGLDLEQLNENIDEFQGIFEENRSEFLS